MNTIHLIQLLNKLVREHKKKFLPSGKYPYWLVNPDQLWVRKYVLS